MKPLLGISFLLLSTIALFARPVEQPTPVSLIRLIVTPEKFDGKLVSVVGFLASGREFSQLYFHKEDSDHVLAANSIWFNDDQMPRIGTTLNLKYVLCVGVFREGDKGSQGHSPLYSGGITQIRSCKLWSDPEHPRADTTNYQISNYRGWQTLWRVARVASEEMNWVAHTSGEAVKKTSSWISATLAFENLSIRSSTRDL